MSIVVEGLGLAEIKGLGWSAAREIQIAMSGVIGDRHWSPVTENGICIKATDFPSMVGIRFGRAELPAQADVLHGGQAQTIRYYSRSVSARVYKGALADRLSAAAGQRLYLARADGPGRFLWSSPVSVLLRSELEGLPDDAGRYRANVVIDDRQAPLPLVIGVRLEIGEAVLEVERELERCVVINHDPATGIQDESLLRRLRAGVLLGYGCRVIRPGQVRCGDQPRVRSGGLRVPDAT